VIDLLAILPYFFMMTSMTALRALRALRMLRLLRVLKLARVAATVDETDDRKLDWELLWRDSQFGLILVCSLIALVDLVWAEHTNQVLWLAFGSILVASISVRRWCIARQHRATAALLAMATLFIGVAIGYFLDQGGDVGMAVAVSLITAGVVFGSALVIEMPADAL